VACRWTTAARPAAQTSAEAFDARRQSADAWAVDCLQGDRRHEYLACLGERFCRTGCSQIQPRLLAEGVRCSTCHGDAIVHALTRGTQRVDLELRRAERHDRKHDQDFGQPLRWAAIRHERR